MLAAVETPAADPGAAKGPSDASPAMALDGTSSGATRDSSPAHQTALSLISMTSPRNLQPQRASLAPSFVEFDMSAEGYGYSRRPHTQKAVYWLPSTSGACHMACPTSLSRGHLLCPESPAGRTRVPFLAVAVSCIMPSCATSSAGPLLWGLLVLPASFCSWEVAPESRSPDQLY